jgi:chromate reductase
MVLGLKFCTQLRPFGNFTKQTLDYPLPEFLATRTYMITILGISGSDREKSTNTALLEAAKQLLPENVRLEIIDVSKFPLFNSDKESNLPQDIQNFKNRIKKSHAVLFAASEHNYAISAVLKNAIEWGNRPDNSWDRKPAAIIGASTSPRGGARAQLALRKIIVDLNMLPLNRPQLLVANAPEKFNSDRKLTDLQSRQILQDLLRALLEWTRKLKA